MLIIRLFPFVFALFVSVACHSQSASAQPGDRVEILQQWSGQNGGGAAPAVRALRTIEEWSVFWKQVEREAPVPPNFTRHMAVVISLGEKRTGGFSAQVIGARHQNGKLVIDYREISPPPGMMVTQALTAPWTAALIPRSDLPVSGQPIPIAKPRER
jgi:hypothetical protein